MTTENEAFKEWFCDNYPEGTIISNPSWHTSKIYKAAKADSEQKFNELNNRCTGYYHDIEKQALQIAELQAHINRLLKHIKEDIYQPDNSSSLTKSGNSYCTDCGSLIGDGHLPKCILFTTPTQSLKAHDDELIDKCVQAID